MPIEAETIQLGERVSIPDTVTIKARSVTIGDDVTIGEGTIVEVAGDFSLGRCSILGPRNTVRGMSVRIGEYAYTREDVELGGGGCYSHPDSRILIGHSFFSGEGSVLNCARRLTIGNEVGLGANVGLWTHGGYLNSLRGYPSSFEPVAIGSYVWIPGSSNVLPGVTIGSNVVVGMGSLINRDLPSGCLAGGTPAKVIRENLYPQTLSMTAITDLIYSWLEIIEWKTGTKPPTTGYQSCVIVEGVTFDFSTLQTDRSDLNPIAEDFRNYCRQRGVRFRTGKPYQTLQPQEVKQWLS